jgi:hypothetical protein
MFVVSYHATLNFPVAIPAGGQLCARKYLRLPLARRQYNTGEHGGSWWFKMCHCRVVLLRDFHIIDLEGCFVNSRDMPRPAAGFVARCNHQRESRFQTGGTAGRRHRTWQTTSAILAKSSGQIAGTFSWSTLGMRPRLPREPNANQEVAQQPPRESARQNCLGTAT